MHLLTNMNIAGTAAKAVVSTSSALQREVLSRNPLSQDEPVVGDNQGLDKFEGFKKDGIKEASKKPDQEFERFAENYINDEPEILFVVEYIVEDEILGSLIVWEKYYDSTHYEVFKKNTFQADAKFDRILFLDSQNLEEERSNFIGYIKDVLGFDDIDENGIYIVFDDHLKEDRIYEYKIAATRVPKDAKEVDYDMVLESKGLLNTTEVISTSAATLFSLAGASLGSEDLAWTIAISNDKVNFFGRSPAEQNIPTILSDNILDGKIDVFVPRNVNDILCVIKESMSIFDTRSVFDRLIDSLGGLPNEFKKSFLLAIDEERNTFSYDKFKEVMRESVPVFDLVLDIAESTPGEDSSALEVLAGNDATKKLSSLSISVPNNKGSEALTSVVELSNIFKFVNDSVIIVLYSQEKETFDKLNEIVAEIDLQRSVVGDDTLDEATKEIREEIEDNIDSETNSAVAEFFGMTAGQQDDNKETEESDTSGGNSTVFGFSIV